MPNQNLNNTYCIYIHECPNNKVYIGQTIYGNNPNKRWEGGIGYKGQRFYNAIKYYGWDNIKHNILLNNLSEDEANFYEILLIYIFDSTNRKYGYNVSYGGSKISEETKEKLSQQKIGKNNPMYGKTGNLHHNSKRIICLNNNKIFDSIAEATNFYNISTNANLIECCQGKRNFCGKDEHGEKLIWRYLDSNDNIIEPDIKCIKSNARKVICVTTNKIFNYIKEGADFYNIKQTNITACCQGKQNYHGTLEDGTKLVWRYLDINNNIIEPIKQKPDQKKKVICITTNKIFKSIAEAAEYYGMNKYKNNISAC